MQKKNWAPSKVEERVHLVSNRNKRSAVLKESEPDMSTGPLEEVEPEIISDSGKTDLADIYAGDKEHNETDVSEIEHRQNDHSATEIGETERGNIAPGATTAEETADGKSNQTAGEVEQTDRSVTSPDEVEHSSEADVSKIKDTLAKFSTVLPQRTPKQFGAYELCFEIRKDALSTTWAATRDGFDRPVALRIFNARLTDSTQVRNIHKAAGKAANLTHINHVTVYEDGVGEDGAPYIVTDWVEGDSLTETFQVSKRLDIARFLNIFNQACDALTEAHSHLLVHGNLSPNKIILVHDEDDAHQEMVKLIDFGTPPDPVQNAFYLSPEQCLDRNKCDERSDIYSLGCIMYESLVGSPPMIGDRLSQASTNYLHELANQYSKESPEHNALKLLDCIIIKCLQKKPSKRFRNVRELTDALRLVNDCICNGSTRKLPHKAEKLLLFRFLEFFDRKITIGLCAYLILGMVCVKYFGELQLQKSIDQAQMFSTTNISLAITDWKTALSQAQQSQKPPGLQADIHWELADALKRQYTESETPETRNALADEARQHYQAAYEYYRHGSHYRSYALSLLDNLSSMWLIKEKTEEPIKTSTAAQNEVKKLFEAKQYAKCAAIAAKHFDEVSDQEIAYYAGAANQKLADKLPYKKALRYLERAEYYFERSGRQYPSLVATSMFRQGLDPNAEDTHVNLGCKAFTENDLEAAQYHFGRSLSTTSSFYNAISSYQFAKRMTNQSRINYCKEAIEPLEQYLTLQEEIYGKNDKTLSVTLLNLASCYQNNHQPQKAIDAYKRAFKLIPEDDQNDSDVLKYVDLLAKTWHRKEARAELEKRVIVDSQITEDHALLPRLMEAYYTDNMKDKALQLIKSVRHVPEIAKYGYRYDEEYGHQPQYFTAPRTNDDPFQSQ